MITGYCSEVRPIIGPRSSIVYREIAPYCQINYIINEGTITDDGIIEAPGLTKISNGGLRVKNMVFLNQFV